MSIRRHVTTALLSLSMPLAALAAGQASSGKPADSLDHDQHHSSPWKRDFSPLVSKVRRATARYRDVNAARHDQYVPGTPCVSGPEFGAMGIHFVHGERLGDGVLDAEEPEALIYEPLSNGALRLVGVEFIVYAAKWKEANPKGGAPSLDGHLLNYVGAPNRYGLEPFYELHVWAWEHNPNGSFVDWNTRVTCDKQPAG
jgi:hypothetical protein